MFHSQISAAPGHTATASFIPRRSRSKLWADAAYAAAIANGQDVFKAATAAFSIASSERKRVNDFKLAVDCVIARGPVRAREHFGDIARRLPANIDRAIPELDSICAGTKAHLVTLTANGLAGACGRDLHSQIEHQRRARLILRLIRRYGDVSEFGDLVEFVATVHPLIDALRGFVADMHAVRRGRVGW